MHTKRKICILTSVHPVFDIRVFHKQAKTLAGAGYEVILIAQSGRDEVVDGIRIMALPKPRNRLCRMLLTTSTVFTFALKERANVYHFHDPELLPVGLLLKAVTKRKVIYDVHEDYPKAILAKAWIPHYLRRVASTLFTRVVRVGFRFLDAVIAAGDDIRGNLPRSSKLVVIGNFPSLEMVGHAGVRHRLERDREHAVLIYVGGISESRGVKEMVEAVNYLEGRARLILVGTFSDSRLDKEIRAKAGNNLEVTGQVPYESIPYYLEQANIGIVCYWPDPNNIAASWRNNKLFEYMAAGLPIIVSNFPLWKDITEGNNCGLTVNPLDPREIAMAVEYLIEHPDEAKKMGENGKKAILEKYNWENESKKLLTLYDGLLEARL